MTCNNHKYNHVQHKKKCTFFVQLAESTRNLPGHDCFPAKASGTEELTTYIPACSWCLLTTAGCYESHLQRFKSVGFYSIGVFLTLLIWHFYVDSAGEFAPAFCHYPGF